MVSPGLFPKGASVAMLPTVPSALGLSLGLLTLAAITAEA